MQAAEHRAAIYTSLNALSADAVCFATFVWNRVDAHFMYETVAMASSTTGAAMSTSPIAHGLRGELRTKATMAVNAGRRPIIIKGTKV